MSSLQSETRCTCSLSKPSPSDPSIYLSPNRRIWKEKYKTRKKPRLTHDNRQSVDKRTIVENYDLLSLAIDEIVDDGVILETDPTIIVQRVSRAPAQDVAQLKNIDLSEQGMNNLAQFGKAKLGDWLRQGL